LSDVFDEIISKLKQKAETPAGILGVKKYKDDRICQIHCIGKCPGKPCGYFTEKWVRLEDVESAIRQIKQNYVLISKKELKKKLAEIKFYGTKINGQLSDKPEYSPRYLADFIEKELLKEC